MSSPASKDYVLHERPPGSFLHVPWPLRNPSYPEILKVLEDDFKQCVMLYPVMVQQGNLTQEQADQQLACKAQAVEHFRVVTDLNAPNHYELPKRPNRKPLGWCRHGRRDNLCFECIREQREKGAEA